MKELKDQYKKDFELMRTAMNEFDPCGLIALECPIAEYDHPDKQSPWLEASKRIMGQD